MPSQTNLDFFFPQRFMVLTITQGTTLSVERSSPGNGSRHVVASSSCCFSELSVSIHSTASGPCKASLLVTFTVNQQAGSSRSPSSSSRSVKRYDCKHLSKSYSLYTSLLVSAASTDLPSAANNEADTAFRVYFLGLPLRFFKTPSVDLSSSVVSTRGFAVVDELD